MAVNKEINTHSEQAAARGTAAGERAQRAGVVVFSENTPDSHHAHCRGNVAKRSNSLPGK